LVVLPVAGLLQALLSVHLPSLVQAFLSPPVQHFMVHLLSLQLPVQVHPLPLHPPVGPPAKAVKLVMLTIAAAKKSFFIVCGFYFSKIYRI
jgi:hypothetical protein